MENDSEFYVCPYCNEKVYGNKKVFANHIRWCKLNPKYDEIREGTIKKLKNEKVERKEHTLICPICGKEYNIKITDSYWNRGKYKKTCSAECAKKLTAQKTNKKKKNKKISISIQLYNESIGKKIEKKYCKYCGKEIISHKKNKVFCSQECHIKYKHEEYTKTANALKCYRQQCRFQFALSDFPKEFDFKLIEENGWYAAKNHGDNLQGVSRDHMFSIKEGFKNKIDPYFISHPANCELLLQSKNASKHNKCSIDIEKLKERVAKWNEKYGEYVNKINYLSLEEFK